MMEKLLKKILYKCPWRFEDDTFAGLYLCAGHYRDGEYQECTGPDCAPVYFACQLNNICPQCGKPLILGVCETGCGYIEQEDK